MAHTLDLSSARLQAGAVRGSFLREALGKLEVSRIAAESGAIALHMAALLLLLAPMSPPPEATRETEWYPIIQDTIRPPPPPPPPPVVNVVRPTARPPVPIVQPVRADPPPPIEVSDASEIDLPPAIVVADATHDRSNTISQPLTGAQLEYEIAPPPVYPSEAMRAGLEGTVLLRVLVGIDGRPEEVTIERSSGHRVLDVAARRVVLGKWRFKAAMQDGQAVQAIGLVPVDFSINR